MQNVKEEFLGVLEGYHNYENYDQFDHLFMTGEDDIHHHHPRDRVPPVNNTHHTINDQHVTTSTSTNNNCPVSDPRARVRALYEARKARMHARRDKLDKSPSNLPSSQSSKWQGVQYSYPHPDDEHQHRMQTTPAESDQEQIFHDYEDRNNNTPTKSPKEHTAVGLQDQSSCSGSDPPYVNVLSTISEENSLSSKNSSGKNANSSNSFESEPEIPAVPPRRPLIPKNRYKEYLSEKTVPKPGWHDLGEYVTLKAPNQSMISFSDTNIGPAPSMLKPDMLTQSLGASMFSIGGHEMSNFKKEHDTSKDSLHSVRYAKSNVISELYTSQKREKSNLDVSCISSISNTSSTDGTLSRLSDSGTIDYPLHSTVLGASMHSPAMPVSLCETDEDSLMNRTDDTLETIDTFDGDCGKAPHDARTTVSEPSTVLHHASRFTVFKPPKAFDDSYIKSKNIAVANGKFLKNQMPAPRQSKTSVTISKESQIPQLCSEHGLHLNYGGPCFFEDSFDALGSSGESELDFSSVNFNSESGSKLSSKRSSLASKRSSLASRISSKQSSVIHHNSVADTDCDSSYLSECVDDTHFTNDFSEAENYTALYDSRRARMKILRRQTGRGNIKRHRKPVGLSESDLIHDMSERHLSLQATRSSMPDIYNLSPTSSFSSNDLKQPKVIPSHHLDSSLHDSTLKSHEEFGYSSYDDESDSCSNSISHNDTVVSGYGRLNYIPDDIEDSRSEPRPVSLCTSTTGTTTTDESPESNGGMTVPVNSPNITDSGGSSSRPTTDAYDYVEVPINIPKVAKLLRNKLSLQQQQQQPAHHHYNINEHQQHGPSCHQSRSMQSIIPPDDHTMSRQLYAPSCSGSQQSSGRSNTAHSDPSLNTQHYTHHRQPEVTLNTKSFPQHHSKHRHPEQSLNTQFHSHHRQPDRTVNTQPLTQHHPHHRPDTVLNTQPHHPQHREIDPRPTKRYPRSQDSGFATHESERSRRNVASRTANPRAHSYDALQGEQPLVHSCQAHSSSSNNRHREGGHIAISNPEGFTRTVVQHSAVARNMNKDRKRALAKKLKQFNNNFHGSKGHPQIKTLGHF